MFFHNYHAVYECKWWILPDPSVQFVCWQITPFLVHHYAELFESIVHVTYLLVIFCGMCVYDEFYLTINFYAMYVALCYQLTLFSANYCDGTSSDCYYPIGNMIISHCLGFGHATVVFAVHFAIFFSIVSMNISSCLLWFTYWYSYIDTILWLCQIIYRIEECLVLAVLSSGITTQNKAIPRTALQ